MSTKGCELCTNPARMFCDSDQASLCWDCDEKVHAANFLVAKHTRTLLCHVCYCPTPWKAAGPKLGPTVSVCHTCADHRGAASGSRRQDEDGDGSQESESDDGEYYSDSDDVSEDDEDEDGENQVVPLSTSSCGSPPPTSCFSEENVSFSSKRTRDNVYESEDEDVCCSSQNLGSKLDPSGSSFQEIEENCTSSMNLPFKMRRMSNDSQLEQAAGEQARLKPLSGTIAIVEKLRRFQQQNVTREGEASAMILGLCKLTRN